MTQEEIYKNNRLIAKFMGIKVNKFEINAYSDGYNLSGPVPKHFNRRAHSTPEAAFDRFVLISEYHSSWDWLMPVVEKINREHEGFSMTFGNKNCVVGIYNTFQSAPIPKQFDPDMKKALYRAVVLFIEYLYKPKIEIV